MSEILKFAPNIPQQVILRYGNGKHVKGQFGEQVMYSLQGNAVMYVPVIVEKKLQELGVKKDEPVEIVKLQADKKTEWRVTRIQDAAKPQFAAKQETLKKPQGAATLLNQSSNLDRSWEGEAPIPTQLEWALKTALHAAQQAEKYSQEIGHPVQFDKDDVRLMAQTLVINARKREDAA